jgi:PAB-dependent poly(A)-specific ribonuclease subunit 2
MITVPEAEGHLEDLISPWFLFNDFSVQNISEKEALSFPGKWKVGAFMLERSGAYFALGPCHLIPRTGRLSRTV